MTSSSRSYQDLFATADAPSITHQISATNKSSEETAKQHFGGRHQKGHHQEVVQDVASNVDEGEVAAPKAPRHRCPDCGSTFAWKKNLYQHLRKAHEYVGVYNALNQDNLKWDTAHECNICGEHFSKQQMLYDHRRRKHSKTEIAKAKAMLMTFICEACHRGHHNSESLRIHQYRCK